MIDHDYLKKKRFAKFNNFEQFTYYNTPLDSSARKT